MNIVEEVVLDLNEAPIQVGRTVIRRALLEEDIGIGDLMTNIELLERDSVASVAASQPETELRRALENEEFQVYYQPIVSLETSELIKSSPSSEESKVSATLLTQAKTQARSKGTVARTY